MLQEFKPALLFLGKFLAVYFMGNVLYGIFIEMHGIQADPVTEVVTKQSCAVIEFAGTQCDYSLNSTRATVDMSTNGITKLAIFEGCNGVNVMIVFVAFIVAFGGSMKRQLWFVPFGLIVIHLFNLLRLTLLYHTAVYNQKYFYYFHKYFFTAVLYLIVFVLWYVWVAKLNPRPNSSNSV